MIFEFLDEFRVLYIVMPPGNGWSVVVFLLLNVIGEAQHATMMYHRDSCTQIRDEQVMVDISQVLISLSVLALWRFCQFSFRQVS